MLKKLFFSLGILLSVNLMVFSQSGELKGKITDKETKEPIPFANIIIERGGKQFGGSTSDFDGNYTIKPIPAGTYDVKATYVGYKPLLIKGVIINADKMTFNNIVMEPTATTLETFTVVDYKVPLISKDQTTSGATLTSEDISRMPGRSAESVAATMGGVQSVDGSMGSVRGARTDGSTVTYVDGVRVRGNVNLPKSAIGEVSMILGGQPAKYGEGTGGIMNVVSQGPSREFAGGIELLTSQFLDKFGRNLASFSLTGPLLKSKDDKKSSLLGFFLSGEFGYIKDTRPFADGDYKVNDAKKTFLEQNPLIIGSDGTISYNADLLRKEDLEKIYTKENGANYSVNLQGKIDVRTTANTSLTFGGFFNYDNSRIWSRYNSLLNSNNNGEQINNEWSIYGKFMQRFPTDKDSKSLIKNVFYQVQVDYSKTSITRQDVNHKDNLFNYGYVGKFTTTIRPTFVNGSDTVDGIIYDNALVLANVTPIQVDFERSEINPILANYTSQLYNSYYGNYLYSLTTIADLRGMRNGDIPTSIYDLYSRTGSVYNSYLLYDQTQIGINVNGSADVGNHAFEFGIQYEQLTDRSIGYAPAKLWELARRLTNSHISQLDFTDAYLHRGGLQDTIYYNYIYNQARQSTFDINLRQKLGMPVNGHTIYDWIDIDKYDPSMFSIDMFSPDELFDGDANNSLVNYYGYDYKGEKLKSKPSLNDFFTARDENGKYKREIGAFEPLYMAGYIQDKFAFNDLVFNIGVRVDRYDANQMVLKDPYLFYDSKKVKDLVADKYTTVLGGAHPSNIGSDYVVYVDDYKAEKPQIKGYRNGDTWYNATGAVITDPSLISGNSGRPTPYRVNKDQAEISIDAFKDYEPQTTFMPRIAFSFPISDEALFFAHYDIITKRPNEDDLRIQPISYLYISSIGSTTVNNPNLLPEQTTDYELGFQQKISNSSSLKFSAYYREVRNLIQTKRLTGADPNPNYFSYSNVDFGTIKGLTIAYDLRRTGNVRLSANYTLQFADGTGSNADEQKALINSGQPNLRTINPLTYDQRHAVKASFDFRFANGKKYNGPKYTRKIKGTDKVKTILLLENTGINITFNGSSGTPYTKRDFVENTIIGQLNGSRLPWRFWMDAQINKSVMLKVGNKMLDLNIYVSVLNVLNTQNTLAVYSRTGSPDDDGYLTNPKNQADINAYSDPQSYRDLRSVAANTPYNYSLPRRIRLGVELNF